MSYMNTQLGVVSVERIRGILRSCEVFSGLSPSRLENLAGGAILESYDRRQTIRLEGSFGVIGSGRVRLVQQYDGRELTMAYLGAGDVLGELGLIAGDVPASAVATERVEHVRLPADVMRALVAESPLVASRLLVSIGERCLQAERRIVGLLTRPVESRVVEFLLSAAERHGVPDVRGRLIGVKFTHREIASYVGSTRETVTLTLGDLKRRGLIAVDHRRVIVLDDEGLRRLL